MSFVFWTLSGGTLAAVSLAVAVLLARGRRTRTTINPWEGLAIALCACVGLNACSSPPTAAQQAQLSAGVATLAAIAAANNATVADVVRKGALFCDMGGGSGIVAVATAAGAPASVMNQAADAVAKTCAAFQAVPVPPPADPGAVPVVMAAETSLPAVAAH